MSPHLKEHQKDWIEAAVNHAWEQTSEVNSVLLTKEGVPPLLGKDSVIRSAQATLTPTLVDFMKESSEPFRYQTKLLAPSHRLDLLRTLLDKQPKTMGTADQEQQCFEIWGFTAQHLVQRASRVDVPTWYWEFGQGGQIISVPSQSKPPYGMRGTDRFTWATRMAAALRDGKPLDVHYPDDAQDSYAHDAWHSTILDEEGTFWQKGKEYSLGGTFCPSHRHPFIDQFREGHQRRGFTCHRLAVDGVIFTS